ncbi:hypothetical protein EIN_341320 [Entamoeba invadens IP1]|uniref:TLDc domain-containing protein n=1 Tax=Entamoeba invadens IP1 TaxID=370355 RepID=A0A0A1UDT3_ENTIV|nr:hypothetical protein EIN_341320 [Entamoeba invadens IP1]ELP94754.1 hypothetical protein EIN_341320 [Entamoeba invadens IP1]|eukprot:XP_004261525.1 hypothetical protein EIN_341320 [Entamoeba invadens IP1]
MGNSNAMSQSVVSKRQKSLPLEIPVLLNKDYSSSSPRSPSLSKLKSPKSPLKGFLKISSAQSTPRDSCSLVLFPMCRSGDMFDSQTLKHKTQRIKPVNFIETIQQWTSLTKITPLFNSDEDSLSAKNLNASICCHKNVCIVIKTEDNDLIGCFHQDVILPSKQNVNQKSCSNEFFIFSYNKNFSQKMEMKEKGKNHSITIHKNSETNFVFSVYSAFWILSDGTINIHPALKSVFKIPKNVVDPLIKNSFVKSTKITNLMAFEME